MTSETPAQGDTSKEFKKFEELTKKLVSVPKKDIKDREKKASKREAKKQHA